MHRLVFLGLLVVLLTSSLLALADDRQPRPMLDYRTQMPWLATTPGVSGGAVGGFANPAVAANVGRGRPELAYWLSIADDWYAPAGEHGDFADNFGFATSGFLNFGLNSHTFVRPGGDLGRVYDWQLGLSSGSRRGRLGVAYRWAAGDNEELGREDALVLGSLWRPGRAVSLGLTHTTSVKSNHHQSVLDLGLRPVGTDRLTLFGDYTLDDGEKLGGGYWGAGLQLQPINGVVLSARVYDDPSTDDLTYGVGLGFAFNDEATRATAVSDDDRSAYYLAGHINPPIRNVSDSFRGLALPKPRTYAVVNLENRYLTYQKYRLFDDRRVAWLDLAGYLDAVERNPQHKGVVLDLRDFVARPSLVWELRGRLQDLQAAGKEVVVLINRVDTIRYYLACVADRIIMDPEGDMALYGIATGRSYFADMLDNLGLGFQELRYFKYKSAAEVGSRMDMSEGQREQSQRLVDVIYEELRQGICDARGLTPARYDELVNDTVGLTPAMARELGLVDDIGRREDINEILGRSGHPVVLAGAHPRHRDHAFPEERWGEPPSIAVVYAVGGCDMDTGIKGRATGQYLQQIARDPSVKAVVLRADSPGGDPLPSDLVADGLKACRERGKPVIVSQGDVAASGGYWISMDGDDILTTPLTITGSIGVIAAWIHDDGAGEKLGINYDGVKRGEHADLLRQWRVPGLGLGVPHRALDEKELGLVKNYILDAYESFVERVATARGLDVEAVKEIAQGRVWMGGDAIDHGLCDGWGGMTQAIDLARERAGLSADEEVRLTEYPPRPLMDLSGLFGGSPLSLLPFGLGLSWPAEALAATDAGPAVELEPLPVADYARWYLEAVGDGMGRPKYVLPPEDMPTGWAVPQ